jgi:tyrosyl-tRNA synthetase
MQLGHTKSIRPLGGTNHLVFASKGEARRMIKGGGVSINKQKLSSPDQKPEFALLQGKYLLAQKGKKNYFLIRVL